MIQSPVIVMALYDIGRDNWDNYKLSYNTYLFWMRNTLSVDCNIVIYTEDKFVSTIKEMREEFDPQFSKTRLVVVSLEELDCYKLYYSRLVDLMESEIFKKKIQTNVPEMTKPLYNIIMFNKVFFLKDAINHINGDFYIWADAGGLRDKISNYQNKQWPCLSKINTLDNSKITFFSHNSEINIRNKEYHSLSQIRNIQGTCFFVPKLNIDFIVDKVTKTVDESIMNQYIGSDEKILDIICSNYQDKFNLIKCNWREYFDLFKESV